MFRNRGGMAFEDVTARAGIAGEGYSTGAAAADYDNDGRVDLFVAGINGNRLYRNRGDGTFADVTAASGIKTYTWSVAAGWFDYDNDGRLDLFVVNYVRLGAAAQQVLRRSEPRRPRLLSPEALRGAAERAVSQSRRRYVRGRVGTLRNRAARRQGDERRLRRL